MVKKYLLEWPNEFLVPVIDLNRIFLLHYNSESIFTSGDKGFRYITRIASLLTTKGEKNLKIVALRAMCNLFNNTSAFRSLFELMNLMLN